MTAEQRITDLELQAKDMKATIVDLKKANAYFESVARDRNLVNAANSHLIQALFMMNQTHKDTQG